MKKRLFNQGKQFERLLKVERAAVNVEERTITLAFAGETPCERWYGTEILDCKKESIRLERLLTGGPLLLGHDADKQIGVVESVEIGEDKVCRAVVRFSRSALAEEILADVQDGIRGNVSVGYMIHDAILVRKDGDKEEWRITDWEPYEVSIVPMPADFKTAGVGRSAEEDPEHKPNKQENRTMKKCKHCGRDFDSDFCGCAAERKAIAAEARTAEFQRCKSIRDAARAFADRGGLELAEELAGDENATVETFRERMLAKIDAQFQESEKTRREGHGYEGRVEVVESRYDKRKLEPFVRAADGNIVEAKRNANTAGMWARAVLFGNAEARRWCIDQGLDLRVMTSDSNPAGGFTVPTPLESAIIDLRAEYGILRRIAEIYNMTSGTLPIPVRKTGTTAYFKGQQASATESDMSWGEVTLVAKDLFALTRLSNALVEDSTIDIAGKVAMEHAYAFAVKEDSCFIDGDGTATYGGITGLKALLETSGMKGIKTCATNTDTPTEIISAEIDGLMAVLPSYARRGASFLASPSFDELIFGRLMRAAGGNSTITLAGEVVPAYGGKPRQVCEPCYSDATADLTGKAMAFYGNFFQGVAVGDRRGIIVQVLRERYAEYGQIGVLGSERVDIVNHGVGDTSAAGPIVALIGG